jgi:hypothetical protein
MENPIDPGLQIFTIYRNPSDYPDRFVLRRSVVTADGRITNDPEPRAVVETLDEARRLLPFGLVHFHRAESDPLPIVEVWL